MPQNTQAQGEQEGNKLEAADIAAGKRLAKHRDTALANFTHGFGKLGDQEPLYALGIGMLTLSFARNFRWMRPTAVSVLTKVAMADLSKRAVKSMVKRTRPHKLLDEGKYERDLGGGDKKDEQSFPSGHMACTVAAAGAIARRHPVALPAVVAFAGIVGIARVVKGAHWTGDVAAGLLLGIIADAAVTSLAKVVSPRS